MRSPNKTTIFVLLIVLESLVCSVAASPSGGWELSTQARSSKNLSSSLFGVLGNVLGGGTENERNSNSGFSKRSYTRLGRHSISRESSSELLNLNGWLSSRAVENACVETTFTESQINDRMGESPRRLPKWLTRRGRASQASTPNETGHSINACIDASLVATPVDVSDAMTSPIVPLTINMDEQKGEEFSDPETMDRMVASGLEMATQDKNDWIEWSMHAKTKKLMDDNNQNEMAVLENGGVMVYIGKAKVEGHGSNLPLIKTKSLLPLAAEEMADLLMDSSRVKIYNKLSVGRNDVTTLGPNTKIVCNLTKPPIAKSNMVSCTMMHSQKLKDDSNDYFVVSRATPGMVADDIKELPRNDILLGVNLLQEHGPNECIMTAVTHVYSPALPTILAKKMGVGSAINFVKDIRNSCGKVAS